MTTKILLIRHGQTVWNLQGRPRGRAEVPLDEVGMSQAEATAGYIADRWSPNVIFHSPLRRTRETAARIAALTGAPLQPHSGFADVDFGAWEGRLPEDIEAHWGDAWRTWQIRPQDVIIPGGENLADAQSRAMAALREICLARFNQVLVVVSHTAINRLLLMGMLDIGLQHFWHLSQDAGAINVISYDGQEFTLDKMNLTHHL